MKTYRQQFEEENLAVVETGPDGKARTRYVYIGNWHGWSVPPERMARTKRVMALAAALGLVSFLLGALMPSPLTWDRIVGLFTGLGLAAIVVELVGVIQFCAAKEKLTRQYFSDINTKMKLAPLAHAILLAGAAIACVPLMPGAGMTIVSLLVPLCFLASALAAAGVFTLYRGLPQVESKNDAA